MLAQKTLLAVICLTPFYYLKRTTFFTLFLGMGKRILYPTRNRNANFLISISTFLPLNQTRA
jgi:hypothetical protein